MSRYCPLSISYITLGIFFLFLSGCHDHDTKQSPIVEPPILEPPTVEPPTVEPPTVDNVAPIASQVIIIPPTQPNNLVQSSYIYIDEHDLEGSSIYSWLIDDIELSNSLTFLLPSNSEGKNLTFCVTPVAVAGEETLGLQVCTDITITGEYSKPSAESFVLTDSITTGIEISASYTFTDENGRLEGDSIVNWKIDDIDFSSDDKITLAANHQGSQLKFCLTPIAISGENATGDVVCSGQTLIGAKAGTAPTITNLLLVNFAKAGNNMSVTYDYNDVDNDLEDNTVISWLIDSVEVSIGDTYILPSNSAGKTLSVCATAFSVTGLPTNGTAHCTNQVIADIVISGELELQKTINLEIKGYTYTGVTWRVLHPTYAPVRSTSDNAFLITGQIPTESSSWFVANDIEVCIDTIEEGELCLSVADQPDSLVTGGMPIELDGSNNITKRVIAPVSFIDLSILGVTKRLHRPLNVTESILLNATTGGAVPLHNDNYLDASPIIDWAIYNQITATSSCSAIARVLPVQGNDDISDAFGLQQYYDLVIATYPEFTSAVIKRALGWPAQYFRSSSFHSAGNHYDFYLVSGDANFIDDNTSEAVACQSTLP